MTTDADVISLVSLTQGAVCPSEVAQLTCSVQSAAISWRIATLGVEIDFVAADPVDSIESSGGFVGTLTVKSAGLTNSTLSFITNSSLNGIIVECHDTGIFPVDIKNITLSFVDAGAADTIFDHVIYTMYVGIPSNPINLATSVLNCFTMNITWTTPTNIGGEGILITSYIITVYPPPSLSYSSCIGGVCNTTEEFFILSGLNYNTNYIINVSASNCAGTGNIAIVHQWS